MSVAAAMLVIGYVILVRLEPFKHDAVSFEIPPSCAASDGKKGNTVTSEWKEGTLTVRTAICVNCSSRIDGVTAQVLGDRVLLNVLTSTGPMHAACDCEHPLVVRLARLPEREYTIMGVPRYSFCE